MKKEEILKFYQTYKLYIFPSIVTLSSLILIVFIIYPQMSRLLTGQKTEGLFLEKSKNLEAKAQTLESYDSSDLAAKVSSALSVFPIDKDFTTGISLLQDFTIMNGFSIASMTVGTGPKGVNTQSYNIKLDLVGPLSLLPAFLSNIENSPRLMRINSLETSKATDPNLAAVSVTVDILYSSAQGNFGTVDSPLPALSERDEEVLAKIAKAGGSLPRTISGQPSAQQPSIHLPGRGKSNPFE